MSPVLDTIRRDAKLRPSGWERIVRTLPHPSGHAWSPWLGTHAYASPDALMSVQLHGARIVVRRFDRVRDRWLPTIVVDPTATLDQLYALIEHLQRDAHPSPQGGQHVPA